MSELASASGAQLVRLVLESPGDQLVPVLANPALNEEVLVATLRRRDLAPEFVSAVAADMAWAGKYLVKVAITMNPRTPKPVAMNLVKFLYWRDLVKVINNFSLDPPVRIAADNVLKDRLVDMELGERIALARLGSREVVRTLKRSQEAPVFAALLVNPRLTEEDLLPILNDPQTPAPILTTAARHPRWSGRHALRMALVRNPTTPMAVASSLLVTLAARDLREVIDNPTVPAAVREAAGRVLEAQARRAAGHADDRPGRG